MPQIHEPHPTNRLFVPSSRAETGADGRIRIGENARRRGDRALTHYFDNREAFRDAAAFILCSGGYSVAAHKQQAPADVRDREAMLLADHLIHNGVPANKVETETKSTSAFSNVAEAVLGGWINPLEYDQENQLGVVAPGLYQKRLRIILGKVGVPAEVIQPLEDYEDMSFVTELAGRAITRYYLRDASGPEDLLRAEAQFNQSFLAGHSRNKA